MPVGSLPIHPNYRVNFMIKNLFSQKEVFLMLIKKN
jgi:hypothetical protein